MHSEQQIFDYLQQKFGIRFTEQQQAAVQTIDGPVLLLAVPGAGKTTVMVARIANMIFCHGIDPSAILTITFSKAGAQDMRRRYEGLFARHAAPAAGGGRQDHPDPDQKSVEALSRLFCLEKGAQADGL